MLRFPQNFVAVEHVAAERNFSHGPAVGFYPLPVLHCRIRSNTTLRSRGTRTSTGSWTITGVEIGRPLLISVYGFGGTSGNYARIEAISGLAPTGPLLLGSRGAAEPYALGLSEPYYPTSGTVVIDVQVIPSNLSLVAQQ